MVQMQTSVVTRTGPPTPVDLVKWRTLWRSPPRRQDRHIVDAILVWLTAVSAGLQHETYVLEAMQGDCLLGLLPLAFVKSALFGRFLVSLPYVNSAGVIADDVDVAVALISPAVALADELDVRYLELRHEVEHRHPGLTHQLNTKVCMPLALPSMVDYLWRDFTPKVRNQIRKGEKHEFSVSWGRQELLDDFYRVFSVNMRDLGTPVFSRRLFSSILTAFPAEAELCVVSAGREPVAAALSLDEQRKSEVTSASSLWCTTPPTPTCSCIGTCCDGRSIRGQSVFDFGRSSVDSPTFRFKKQWDALPHPTIWQYYVRKGTVGACGRRTASISK